MIKPTYRACEHCIPTQPCVNCKQPEKKQEQHATPPKQERVAIPVRKCIFSGSGNPIVNHWYP